MEDRPLDRPEGGRVPVVYPGSGDVGGEEVGGELDPGEGAVEAVREGADRERLCYPRHPLKEGVAAGKHRREHLVDNRLLSDDHRLHAGANRVERGRVLPCPMVEGCNLRIRACHADSWKRGWGRCYMTVVSWGWVNQGRLTKPVSNTGGLLRQYPRKTPLHSDLPVSRMS